MNKLEASHIFAVLVFVSFLFPSQQAISDDREETTKRISATVSSVVVPYQFKSGKEFTISWAIQGYSSDYRSKVAVFLCEPGYMFLCGIDDNASIESPELEPDEVSSTNISYKTHDLSQSFSRSVEGKNFSFRFSGEMPKHTDKQEMDVVIKFYKLAIEDWGGDADYTEAIIPGGVVDKNRFPDNYGRRIKSTSINNDLDECNLPIGVNKLMKKSQTSCGERNLYYFGSRIANQEFNNNRRLFSDRLNGEVIAHTIISVQLQAIDTMIDYAEFIETPVSTKKKAKFFTDQALGWLGVFNEDIELSNSIKEVGEYTWGCYESVKGGNVAGTFLDCLVRPGVKGISGAVDAISALLTDDLIESINASVVAHVYLTEYLKRGGDITLLHSDYGLPPNPNDKDLFKQFAETQGISNAGFGKEYHVDDVRQFVDHTINRIDELVSGN